MDEEVSFESDDEGNVEVEETYNSDNSDYIEKVIVPSESNPVKVGRDEQGNMEIEFSFDDSKDATDSSEIIPVTGEIPTQNEQPLTIEASEGLYLGEDDGEDYSSSLPSVDGKKSNGIPKQEVYKGIDELNNNLKTDYERIKKITEDIQQKSKDNQNKLQVTINKSGAAHNEKVKKVISDIPVPSLPTIPPYSSEPTFKLPFVTNPNTLIGKLVKLTCYYLKFAETTIILEDSIFFNVANVIFTIADKYCASGNLVSGKQELETVNALTTLALNPEHINNKNTKKLASKAVMERIKQQYETHITEASNKFGISKEQIRAIIGTESAGKSDITNGSAFGLMQITKSTWNGTRTNHPELASYDFDSYWKDPQVNILFGTAVLKDKMKSIGVSAGDSNFAKLAVSAYNAGEGTVKKAIGFAKQAGSSNPTADCIKPEYLKTAIASTAIYKFYFSGQGYKRNPHMKDKGVLKDGSTLEEATNAAIDLKYQEISRYPNIVDAYMELQQ